MTQVSLRVDDERVRLGLYRLGQTLPNVTKAAVRKGMKAVKKEASGGYSGGNSYRVPERQGQKYIRTGEYGKSFDVVEEGLTFKLKSDAVQNGRRYTRYVGGYADGTGQSWFHRGRWPLIRDVVLRFAMSLTQELEAAIKRGIEAVGL